MSALQEPGHERHLTVVDGEAQTNRFIELYDRLDARYRQFEIALDESAPVQAWQRSGIAERWHELEDKHLWARIPGAIGAMMSEAFLPK